MRRRLTVVVAVVSALLLLFIVASATGCGSSTTTQQTTFTPGTATTLANPGTADGGKVYAANCASCHGNNRQGGKGPTLAPPTIQDLGLIETRIQNGYGEMPGFKGKLTDAEIAAVAEYVFRVN